MSNFTRTLFCAGFGGQGVMVLGQLVAYAGIKEGRYVSWLPSYGPEMRGGTANCGVTVSDKEISSPFVVQSDIVVVLNQPSLDKYESFVSPGGILIYNQDLAEYPKPRTDIKIVPISATKLSESVNNPRALNVVLLGAIVALSDVIENETAKEIIKEKLGARKPEYLESNLKAYELGREAGLKFL
ncbi:MAG: 2-oxoacid:acceptor oxidoreductase family protein [Synergistaceae bacterium]